MDFNIEENIIKSNLSIVFLVIKNKTIKKIRAAKQYTNKTDNKNVLTCLINYSVIFM